MRKLTVALLLIACSAWAQAQIVTVGNTAFEIVNQPGAGFTWSDAQAAAATRTYGGLNGQLASILNASEQNAVSAARMGTSCFLGASDAAVEGEWRWLDGTQFWQGNNAGSAVNGMYNNWNAGEPNDLGGNEDVLMMNPDGTWNDASSVTNLDCYIVRYNLALLPVPANQPWSLLLMALSLLAAGGYLIRRQGLV